MRLVSTAGGAGPDDLPTAVFGGLAPDGGLYVPERVPPLSRAELRSLRGRPLHEVAGRVAVRLLGDALPDGEVRALVQDTLDFPIPLVRLDERTHVLELFHGPTGSFKDVGARFLAGLVSRFGAGLDRDVAVLVATSGDTGSAVASAFRDARGVRTLVLFPEGKVSRVQQRQITGIGGNVVPVAVRGTFDDCQALVKRGLADRRLRETTLLTSANSINVGRLLPQSFYYVHAWSRLDGAEDAPPLFSVPSGNLGNLTGGVLARRLGLPVAGFVAGTNVNDTLVRLLDTGRAEPGSAVPTLSSAMDVADPSNLERLLHMHRDDPRELARAISASAHTDEETLEAIRAVHAEHDYLMDPHTAVGWLALRQRRRAGDDAPGIVLATASPAKFPETVRRATGFEPDWRSMLPGDDGEPTRPGPERIEPDYEQLLPILRGVPTGDR